MLAHYLAVALAKFRKSPFTTAANVLTLALGLACFIAAYGVATYWRSADGYHQNAERIFVVGQVNRILGQAGDDGSPQSAPALNAISSWTMAKYLREDFPELERIARAVPIADTAVAAGDEMATLDMAIVDPDFLSLFDFDFVAGDSREALLGPNSVVLTEETAARLFGDAPALGRSVLINGGEDAVVTGVIRTVRQPSFMGAGADATLRFDLLRDWASSQQGAQLDGFESWIGITALTFVQLPPSLSVEALNARLPDFLERRIPANDQAIAETTMRAFPVSELTTFNLNRSLFGGDTGFTAVSALLALAALTLLIACINYANLATAQATGRAREIGMRRVLGAGPAQVMAQTWLESTLLTAIAAAVALLVLALAAPAIRAATDIDILFFLLQGAGPLAVVAGIVVAVGLLAGAYPAIMLSRVQPADVLRSGRSHSGPQFVARILVGVQFASASFLLILLTVTQVQRAHLERTALAPHEDPIVVLNDLIRFGVDYDTLAARLAQAPHVRGMTVVDHVPWGTSFNGVFMAPTNDPGAAGYGGFYKSVGYDYFETLSLPVLAGRAFDRERDAAPVSLYAFTNDPARALPVVVDRRYAEALGFETPQTAVGRIVYGVSRSGVPPQAIEIVGVTETEWTRLGANGEGTIYTYGPRAIFGSQWPVVRVAREDVAAGVAEITAIWNDLAPTIPADIRFFDALFEQSFRAYARVSQIFVLLAGSAFIIASIGQLGIAVHVASRRRHEMGVRKTLGSTTLGIVRLLLIDFSKPILVANLLAWPLGYLAAQVYLQGFASRVDLTPAPFAISMAITLAIAWLAVIGEVLKVASVRPAEVLRHA